MKLLLLSNSTNAGEEYLAWPINLLSAFRNEVSVSSGLFIPYAGVTVGWDAYSDRVSKIFRLLGIELKPIHQCPNAVHAVKDSESIVVGGGNTFRLVQQMHSLGLMKVIRERVLQGTPYIGWSAGANIAGPTMCTTNDMPIIQPESFDTLGLIPYQINPHFLDANPEGHGGETREQRILEYLELNPDKVVVGLREGSALWMDGPSLVLKGTKPMRLFKYHQDPLEINPGLQLADS